MSKEPYTTSPMFFCGRGRGRLDTHRRGGDSVNVEIEIGVATSEGMLATSETRRDEEHTLL